MGKSGWCQHIPRIDRPQTATLTENETVHLISMLIHSICYTTSVLLLIINNCFTDLKVNEVQRSDRHRHYAQMNYIYRCEMMRWNQLQIPIKICSEAVERGSEARNSDYRENSLMYQLPDKFPLIRNFRK